MEAPPGLTSSSLKVRLRDCMKRLESMATDHECFQFPLKDAIFLDDLLLRLRLWTADIRGDEKLEDILDWADQIELTATTLQALISGFDKTLQALEAVTTATVPGEAGKGVQVEPGASEPRSISISEQSRKGLLEAVTKLTTYTAPLQAAANVSESDRTAAQSTRINERLRSQSLFKPQSSSILDPYVLLHIPLLARETEYLLGSIVQEPGDLRDPIPSNGLLEWPREFGIQRIHQEVVENYSILMDEVVRLQMGAHIKVSVPTSTVGLAAGVGHIPDITASVSYQSHIEWKSSRHGLRGPTVTTCFIIRPPDYCIKWVLNKYLLAREEKKPKWVSRSAYMIVGIKRVSTDVTGDLIFAVQYMRIKYKTSLFGQSLKVKTEFNDERALL